MKRLSAILTLAAATLLSVAPVFAQELSKKDKFYQTVPRHEFFFEGFGGFAPLVYTVDQYSFGYPTDGQTPAPTTITTVETKLSTLLPWKAGDLFHDKYHVGVGYGGGFGYIYHFHRVWGFMTGLQFAVYNGGIDLRGTAEKPGFTFTAGANGNLLDIFGAMNYAEVQQYMAAQIPLMMHVMAPMGKGNNHFYFAFGGKLGIAIPQLCTYKGAAQNLTPGNFIYNQNWERADQSFDNMAGMLLERARKNGGTALYPEEYIDLVGDYAGNPLGEYNGEGKLGTRIFSPIASLEIGFRWKLGRGAGLYTGLYFDANLLSAKTEGPILKERDSQSILTAEGLPTIYIRNENPERYYPEVLTDPLPAAARLYGAVHTGLKMKISFGKVKKAPVPVILPPKPDTVVKTVVQTVVVRDTVTKENTVVVRDTVEKVKVVRDTVVVIKEVPQEIKDVMVELSNTLFAFNKFNLNDKAKAGLDKVAQWLSDNPDVNVEISGHTDSVGSDSYNQKLSEDRAKAVYEYFIHEGGISSKRLSYKGYGKSRPIASNDTEEGRQQNRRVELNILQ